MRRFINFIVIFMFIFSLLSYKAFAKDSLSSISADGIVLMDATTGEILYSKNMDTKYPPASTTKIMTALLALENCKLDDIVKVGKKPPFADGSKIYIFEDEELTVKDLLYALILRSANDVSEALAEHISGSTEEFAKLMTKRAAELGAVNTNFVNPSGLYNENHRTTAKDLAIIFRELSKYPEFIEIAKTPMYYIQPTNKSAEKRPLSNENRLLQKNSAYYYEGCEGGKTGYTVQSKHSYVSIASRNGQRLIAVLLHDDKKTYWSDVRKLFDYGFENFTLESFCSKGDVLGKFTVKDNIEIPLLAGEDFYYVKSKDSTEAPKLNINSKDLSESSFVRGDKILDGTVTYKDKQIGTVSLASGEDYSTKSTFLSLKNDSKEGSSVFKIIGTILLTITFLIIVLRVRKIILNRKRKKKDKFVKDIYSQRYKDDN